MNIENDSAVVGGARGAIDESRLQLSALIDGELDSAAFDRTVDALLASPVMLRFWSDAHRAGDWMRSDEVIGVGDSDGFIERFSVRLSSEPTVLAPRAKNRAPRHFWVRTGLPGASVAAALAVVVWVAAPFGRDVDGGRTASATPTVAAVPLAGSAVVEPVALAPVDPERLSDYFAAHRDVTPFGYRGAAAARPAAYTPSAGGASTSRPQ